MQLSNVQAEYLRLEWTLKGFCSLPGEVSESDMARRIERAKNAGIVLRELPQHPADYNTTIGQLYAALPPEVEPTPHMTHEGVEYHPAVPRPTPADLDAPALLGLGWVMFPAKPVEYSTYPVDFSAQLPGTSAGQIEEEKKREDLQGVRGEQHARYVDPVHPHNFFAAEGDFLSHLRIRALFAGVARQMSNLDDETITMIATTYPTPTLAGYVRAWRDRDKPEWDARGNLLPRASVELFKQPGFIAGCLETGRKLVGSFPLPDLMMSSPLDLRVGEVTVNMMFMGILGIDAEVVDLIGHDAAEAAMREAAGELSRFGIQVKPISF